MKPSNQHILEYLIINKNYRDNVITVKSFDELYKIIIDRYDKLGPGTEQNPIDFNDIDVSDIDSFCHKDIGIFEETKFKYIDISDWDVSNATNMPFMFFGCEGLKSVGDISGWDVSKVINMSYMFAFCKKFNQDISNWDVSKVKFKIDMFDKCSIKDKYKPKFKI